MVCKQIIKRTTFSCTRLQPLRASENALLHIPQTSELYLAGKQKSIIATSGLKFWFQQISMLPNIYLICFYPSSRRFLQHEKVSRWSFLLNISVIYFVVSLEQSGYYTGKNVQFGHGLQLKFVYVNMSQFLKQQDTHELNQWSPNVNQEPQWIVS